MVVLKFLHNDFDGFQQLCVCTGEFKIWIIVDDDIGLNAVSFNNPFEFTGTDAQLLKAIEVILEELKNYHPIPEIPEGPDKSK